MQNQIVRKSDEQPDLLNVCNVLYFEQENIRFASYRDDIHLTILDNALLAGKECRTYIARAKQGKVIDVINGMEKAAGAYTPQALRDYFETLTFAEGRYGFEAIELDEKVEILLSVKASNRTYSPFALNRLKPLTKVPAKWTMTHVRQALANNQFEKLMCSGVYTDDYFYDSAINFRKGAIEAEPMLEQIVSSPSGWRTYLSKDQKQVTLNCHHFDNNSFMLKLA